MEDCSKMLCEVEDFMCDQVIISAELDVGLARRISTMTISSSKMRVAVAVLTNVLFPSVVDFYNSYLRNQKSLVDNVRRKLLSALWTLIASYLSKPLISVQKSIVYTQAGVEGSEPERSVICDVLSTPEGSIQADVIFIHGLHGSLYNTWRQGRWRHEKHKLKQHKVARSLSIDETKKSTQHISLKRTTTSRSFSVPNKVARKEEIDCAPSTIEDAIQKGYSPCWPRDWLPMDCPEVRVIALNYTTDPYLWRPVWIKKRIRTNMTERSQEMVEELLKIGVGSRPIIWVGHSKGGLFIKQIIVDSQNNCECPGIGDIYMQTKAILFYSVPHRGSLLADFNLPLVRQSVELVEIQRNCKFVLDLHDKFLKVFEDDRFDPEIFSFTETSLTLMSVLFLKIVAYESADPGMGLMCGVPLDHREICKPAGRDCFLYKELLNLIGNTLKCEHSGGKQS